MKKRFYGQFDPQVDKVIYEKYFPNKLNGVSIECGAFDGVLDNCTKFFEENFNWTTINIEPINNVYENLIINRPTSINMNIALSNVNGIQTIKNYCHPNLGYNWGNASINHTPEHKEYLEQLCGNIYLEQSIQTMTYCELIKHINIKSLDLFVLDVEGHELEVLEGMINSDVLPDVFVIEHGHNSVGFFQALDKLNRKYILDHVSHANSFYIKI